MGATIVDITLVLAMVAIVAGKLEIKRKEINISWLKIIAVVSVPLLLAIDGRLSRIDGAIMILVFLVYYGISIYYETRKQKISKSIPLDFTIKETVIFGVNIALLIFGTILLVHSSSIIADILKIPTYLFGALFLSVCTTSPEFIIELKALFKKSVAIAFGDIFGSVVCNTSLVLGITTMINPITINPIEFFGVGIIMLVVVGFAMAFIQKNVLRRWEGILLFSIYLIFVAVQISMMQGKGLFYGII